jgi:tetratricopeptide (TPR) repeat protein
MKKFWIVSLAVLMWTQAAAAQQSPAAQSQRKQAGAQGPKQKTAPTQERPAPTPQPPSRPAPATLGLDDFGIEIAPDPRLIVMMAALDAAGWDPTPAGERPSVFRELVRKDQAGLDPSLRRRMQDFYARNTLKGVGVTAAEQAARYVSLAYTLGQPPAFDAPPRSDDLPTGVLDVLDFVPLVREFYKQSGVDARIVNYVNMHRAAGDQLRAPTLDMARAVLAYLNTRPETVINERVTVSDPAARVPGGKKKDEKKVTVLHERERHFRVVPDLLGAPGAVNFRAVGDDYYAIVPQDIDPRLSETRRAYVQFILDPLVARFSREVAARRPEIKQLLEAEQTRGGRAFSPDIFLTTARSLVAAADARMDELVRLRVLQIETSRRLQASTDQAAKDVVLKESKERQTAIDDASTAQLAEAYERGAVLAFHFADQLRGVEGTGFDIANFIPDMVAAFNLERELKRPTEYAAAVGRVRESRRRATEARSKESKESPPTDERRASLMKSLGDVNELLRVRNYEEAESRLLALKNEYRDEPLVYFTLGQAASLSAQEAFDETLQAERLNAALQHFRQAILFATPETDRAVVLRAHLSSGRILAHLERREDAAREFDAVIAASQPADRLYQEALAEKKKLGGQQ